MLTYAQYDPERGEQRYFEGAIALSDGSVAASRRSLDLWRCLHGGVAFWGTTCRPWAAVGQVVDVWQRLDHVGVRVRLAQRPLTQALWRLLRSGQVTLVADVLDCASAPCLSPLMIVPHDCGEDAPSIGRSTDAVPQALRRARRGRLPPPSAALPLSSL